MDYYCNTPFWNTTVSWQTERPDLTACFQDTALTWTPCLFAWLLAPFEAFSIAKSRNAPNAWRWHTVAKLLFLVITMCSTIYLLVHESMQYSSTHVGPSHIVGIVVTLLTLVLILLLALQSRSKGFRASTVVPVFWLSYSISTGLQFYSVMYFNSGDKLNSWQIVRLCLFPLGIVQLLLSFFSDAPSDHGFLPLEDDNMYYCPMEEWTVFPRIFFAYLWRVIILGMQDKLELVSLNKLCTDLKCSTVTHQFENVSVPRREKPLRVYVDEQGQYHIIDHPKKKLYLPYAVFALCRWELFLSSVTEGVSIAFSFLPPLMLSYLLSYLSSGEYTWHGYIYALGYSLFQCIFGISDAHSVYFIGFGAYRVQSALTAALYKKVYRISSSARRKYTTGEIMNLMSVDVTEVAQFILLSTQFWSVPVRVTITMVLLWHYLGPACLATLVVMALVTAATTYVARICDKFQEMQMKEKDYRLRQISEILNGIKVLKLYAWELPFIARVTKTRSRELALLKKFAILDSAFGFLWSVAPHVAALMSFGTFIWLNPDKDLTPSIAFVSFTLFMLLRFPMGILPDIISRLIRLVVSLGRLSKFLNEEDLNPTAVGSVPDGGDAVTVRDATFAWSSTDPPVLREINLHVKHGTLVAVIGAVGSGKTSLLYSMLGSLEKRSGSLDIQGPLAYVAQQSWIQNATLKENIVFTSTLDEDWYEKVVRGCALLPDLEVLPAGEDTEIGEKGINLSGGQKVRLSLARAVYQNAELYLLDDPLSAVDVHVASQLFDEVIGPEGLLKSKTRILVTHSVTYLPQVDWIVVLDKGAISEQGTFSQLMEANGSFSTFLKKHRVGEGNSDSNEQSGEEETDTTDGAKEKQDEDDDQEKLRLTDEESIYVGKIGWRVYYEYFHRVGWQYVIPTVVASAVAYGSEFGSGLWLSKWSSDTEKSRRTTYILVYGMFLLSYSIFTFVDWIVFMVGCLRASSSFHGELLYKIMRSPLAFFDSTPMGRIINRFSSDIASIDREVPMNANITIGNIVWMSFLAVVVCLTSWYFVIVVVFAFFLFLGVMVLSLPTLRHLHRLESVSRTPVYSHFSETISGIVSVRAFGVTDQFLHTLNRRVDNNVNCLYHSMALDSWRMVVSSSISLIVSLGASLLTVMGRESLSPGIVGLALSYTLQVSDGLSWTFRLAALLETSLVSVERIKEYLKLPEEAPWTIDETRPPDDWPSLGAVEYLNFSISYRKDLEPVLRAINFAACSGQKIGLVGRTGAGKSTFALSLFRIIEATSGRISVDNVDISEIGLHDLRSKMTIIPQDPVLFAGTLRWNLDPCEENTDEELWTALEQSHLKDFVAEQEAGLEYEITEGGDNLSAGQRQLVCLTRALLRKSKVLVLDEATACVDLATDHLVKETLQNQFKDTTVITIAHRLHTVMDCDRIVVLAAGAILEQGSPQELLQDQGSSFYMMAKDAGLV
ncbi:multidrug resistance-associated protein 1-like [Ornithodoros turicata]|uniref:multidrug resistance-associated protein 1-like n=1 Tax=Ornithodoros turicata TaxID=34597 RepID=UPI00313923C5